MRISIKYNTFIFNNEHMRPAAHGGEGRNGLDRNWMDARNLTYEDIKLNVITVSTSVTSVYDRQGPAST
jgi:hypothetical protein